MEYIIFKDPRLKYRKESFGGIAMLKFQTIILGKREFNFLEKFGKYKDYNLLNETEKKIADKFLNFGILIKIDKSKAEELIKSKL